ncbi:MAG: WHG domain-containing protein [Devosia sp.]
MTLEHRSVRENLVKATLKLMEKGGLESVKARAVAEITGVSVGTIYNLFGNFDRLILSANSKIYEELAVLGQERMARIENDIKRRIGAGKLADTPRNRMLERLCGLGETYVDFVAANASRWSALLAFNRTRGISDNEENQQQLEVLIEIIAKVLNEAPAWNSPAKRRLAGRALWSAVHGIVTTNYFGGDEKTARERTSALLRLLLTAVVDGAFVEATAG